MSDQIIPPYPESLKVKTWEKAKGLMARLSGKNTGVTKLLEAAAKAFKDAPWEATEVGVLAEQKRRGPEIFEDYMKEYHRKYQPAFRQLQTTFTDLSSDLKEKAKALEGDEKLSKFAPLVAKMAADANKFTYAVAWGSVSAGVQKEAVRAREQFAERKKKTQGHIKEIVPALNKVIKKIEEFKEPPSTREYSSLFAQNHRLPGTYIGVAAKDEPELKILFKDFLNYAAANWTAEPKEKTDMKKMLERDLKELKEAVKLAKTL